MADYIIGQGEQHDPRSLNLETQARWRIPNELREMERAPESRAQAAKIITGSFQTAEVLSTSGLYNCAGLAFGSRRVVIDVEHARRILKDDGYRIRSTPNEWRPGDIVLYLHENEPSHVAVVHSISPNVAKGEYRIMVVSAWGESGEYLHEWRDVQPLLGKPKEVWSKRI